MAPPPKKPLPPRPGAKPARPVPAKPGAAKAVPQRPGAAAKTAPEKPGAVRPAKARPHAAVVDPEELANASPLANVLLALDKLCNVIEAENDALVNNRVFDLESIQEDKTRLARLYAHYATSLTQNPALLQERSDSERAAVRAAMLRLQELSEVNMRLLSVLMEANDRLLTGMIDSLREQSRQVPAYYPDGTQNAEDQGLRPNPVYIDQAL